MLLTDHDLKQMGFQYFSGLPFERLLGVTLKLFEDLKEARDRLNQNPQNSSRPSGSFPLWEGKASTVEENTHQESETKKQKKEDNSPTQKQGQKEDTPTQKQAKEVAPAGKPPEKKKPGKQVGAQGHGREVEIPVTAVESHRACECAACGECLTEESPFFARGGLYVLDIEVQEFGIKVTHIKHLYGDTHCECGHITQTKPARCEAEEEWQVELSEWHLDCT